MVLLKVSYRVRAHHVPQFERIFEKQILPVVESHHLKFLGIWRSLVGNAGEYLELWEFESTADFDRRWRRLMRDVRLREILKTTGPMVEEENFALFEPALPEKRPQPEGSELV